MTDNAGGQTASQRKFETVFEHANDAIFIVDIENDQIVSCNSAAEELVEYSREITSRKESHQQAAVLHRMVRHNLRNELTVILAQAEALAASDREAVTTPAEQIRDHASNLTEMTSHVSVLNDMLGSHRAQQHRHEIPDIVDYLVTQLRRDNPDVEFERDLPAELGVSAVSKFDLALEHGSGLGLWIVNWIVTRSGGRIAFEENDPRGSRVIISAPPADSQ
jgi:K+-sensing histidine kinase KdpD